MPSAIGVSIVYNGSLARGEITSQSDFDAYPLYLSSAKSKAEELFRIVNASANLKQFSDDGAFGSPVPSVTMRQNIGGQDDDNRRFTRRMLLLLESGSFGDQSVY
jgi:hypothetical protein